MILDITKVKDQFSLGENRKIFVGGAAPFHESVQHVNLPIQTANYVSDCLPEVIDPRNQFLNVVDAGDKDLVFDCIRLGGRGASEWLEAVDYVVAGYLG
jgi:hypothetical protein